MERLELARLLDQNASRLFGLTLTGHQIEQFLTYLVQLRTWSQSTNLTSITGEFDIIIKHFIDSLAGLSATDMREGARILDVGAGAGFPGIPLKLIRPDLSLTLLEPAHKKSSFLHFIIGLLKLDNVKVVTGTLEQFAVGIIEPFDYIATRALRYDVVLQWAPKLLRETGQVLVYLTKPISKSELERWTVVNEFSFELPGNEGKRVVSVLTAAG